MLSHDQAPVTSGGSGDEWLEEQIRCGAGLRVLWWRWLVSFYIAHTF